MLLKSGDGLTTWLCEGLVVRELPRRTLSRARVLRLEVEATRMQTLSSPRLARFVSFQQLEDELRTEVEFVPGQTLDQLLPLPAEEVLPLALDLFEALRQLHAAGALHRHLKPSRMVLGPGGAVLICPGLARPEEHYLAPEAAGSLARHVGPAIDLYAAGAVLFHALAGRPPFPGPDLLEAHLCAPVPRPGSRLRGLDEVVARLLAKEPLDRYLSAEAVAADLAELRARPHLVPGAAERRATLVAEPAFVGRDEELEVRPGVRLLCAPSGAGKTRLLHELSLRAPGLVLWGRHRPERPSALPLLTELARVLLRDHGLARELKAKLEWECRLLAAPSPELGRALDLEPWSEGPEERGSQRLVRALARVLQEVGPGLVLLDDLQWAGDLTAQLLAELAGTSLAVVGAVRSELRPPDWSLPTVDLPALTDAEVSRLALSMAGPLPEGALAVVTRLADGNPFVAVEALRGLVDTGALRFAAGWRFEGRVEAGEGATGLLARRLAELPLATRRTLALAAVVGRDFDLELLSAAAGDSPAELVDRLDEAGARRIVWSSVGGGYTFVHDRLREQCLASLSEGERQAAHERLALFLEGVTPLPVELLSLHWDSAGQSGRAAPHARVTAARMRQLFAWREAEQHLRIAARGGQPDPLGLAQVCKLRGDYAMACQVLAEWVPGSRFEEAQRLAEQAEIAVKRNEVDQAAELTEAGLGVLGHTQPDGRWACRRHLLGESLRQVAHTYRPPPPRPATPEGLLAARLLDSLTLIRYFQGRPEEMLLSHLAGLNVAQTYPATSVLLQNIGLHASVMTHAGLLERARRFGEQAVSLAGSAWERAHGLSRRAYVDLQCGRLPAARVGYEEAETLFERTGDLWELALTRQNLIEVYLGLGELERGRDLCRVNLAAAAQTKDWSAMTVTLRMQVRLTGGDLPPLPPELKRWGESQSRDHSLLEAVGVALQFSGHYDAALRCLQRSLAAGRTTTSLDIIATLNWLGTTCRRWAEASPGRRASLQRQGRRYLREAERLGRRYRRHLPQTLRELAWLEPARARRHLEESLAVARELSLALEEALTRQARGLLTEAEDDLTWSRLRLSLSRSSVKAHLQELFTRFGVTDRTRLVVEAIRLGLVTS